MENIIKLISNRFSSDSPGFFVKIRNWAFIIGIVAATILALPVSMPSWIITLLTLIIGVCTGLSGGSTITTKDEKIIEETEVLFPTENKPKKFFSFKNTRKRRSK